MPTVQKERDDLLGPTKRRLAARRASRPLLQQHRQRQAKPCESANAQGFAPRKLAGPAKLPAPGRRRFARHDSALALEPHSSAVKRKPTIPNAYRCKK